MRLFGKKEGDLSEQIAGNGVVRSLTAIFVFVLTMCLLTAPGFAADRKLQLGVGKIGNPKTDNLSSGTPWKGSYVYFGKHTTTWGDKIRYRVLSKGDKPIYYTDYTGKNTMFLHSSDSKSWTVFRFNNDRNDARWSTSAPRSIMSQYYNVLTAPEKAAVVKSRFDEIDDYLFLLRRYDLQNTACGYREGEPIRLNSPYWTSDMRSRLWVWHVNGNGLIEERHCDNGANNYPALNLDTSRILFSECVKGTEGEYDAEYKLTLLNDDLNVTVGAGNVYRLTDDYAMMKYDVTGNSAGNADQLALVVTRGEWNDPDATLIHYQRITEEGDKTGSGPGLEIMKLPNDFDQWMTNGYHSYIVAEDVSGSDYYSDCASRPCEITISSTPAPMTLTGVKYPDGIPEQFGKAYSSKEAVLDSSELPDKTTISVNYVGVGFEGEVRVRWKMFGGDDYDPGPSRENIFEWYIEQADLDPIDATGITLSGFAVIKNRDSEPEKPDGPEDDGEDRIVKDVQVLTDVYRVSWNAIVPYDSRKHTAVRLDSGWEIYKAKNKKSAVNDVKVMISKNGEIIPPSDYTLITKNNKNASVSADGITPSGKGDIPYFTVKLKGKEHKEARKVFKKEKFEFNISAEPLTSSNVVFEGIKTDSDGEIKFKKVTHTITVSGNNAFSKVVKLKKKSEEAKTDYVINSGAEDGRAVISITGKNNYCGTVEYK